MINLSAARDMLLDAVQTRKLVQLPLRLQYSLFDQAERIAHQLTSLVNGTDEVVNLVDSVEDITAAIWQYNLHNLSGEVLGLHEKMNQLKAQETKIRQVSREAAGFTVLQESAKDGLRDISDMASSAMTLKASMQGTAEEVATILTKISDQGQKVASFAAQVDQHETTATQQLSAAKQSAADTEAIAKKVRELQTEIDGSRETLQDLQEKTAELLSSTQTAISDQLSEFKVKSEGLMSSTSEAISALTAKVEESGIDLEKSVADLVTDTAQKLAESQAEHDKSLTSRGEGFTETSDAQLKSQIEAFDVQITQCANRAEESVKAGDKEYKKLVSTLEELEGRIRESIERATGYSLFQSFQKRQLDIASAKRFWGYVLGGVVVLSLIASGIFIYELRYVQVYNAAFYLKLSISIPLIYAIAFCNLQYSRERRLEEEYAFKSNISVSLEPYQKLVEKLVDKTNPEELSKYSAFIIDSVTRVYTSPTEHIFEKPGDTNSAEKLIKALGEFIEPVIKGLKR